MWDFNWAKSISYVCWLSPNSRWHYTRNSQTSNLTILQALRKVWYFFKIKNQVVINNNQFSQIDITFLRQIPSTTCWMDSCSIGIQGTLVTMFKKIKRIEWSKINRCRFYMDRTSFQKIESMFHVCVIINIVWKIMII